MKTHVIICVLRKKNNKNSVSDVSYKYIHKMNANYIQPKYVLYCNMNFKMIIVLFACTYIQRVLYTQVTEFILVSYYTPPCLIKLKVTRVAAQL